jgi:hypothetical protein
VTTVFWESVSGKLAERLAAQIAAPAAGFWAGGLGAWILAKGWHGSGERLVHWFGGLSGAEQVIVATGALLVFVVSAAVVDRLAPTALRLLEGYWPHGLGWLRRTLTEARWRRLSSAEAKLRRLEAKRRHEGLTASDMIEFARLDRQLRRVPSSPELRMPTRLGDILRSGEAWPREKYGLDAVVCWPRLWLLLPEQARTNLIEARQELDRSVVVGIWGALLIVWTPLTWWALPAAVVVTAAAYQRSLGPAAVFADLIEAAFDVFRDSLYARTGMPPPAGPTDERRAGELLTAYLWRGETGQSTLAGPDVLSPETDRGAARPAEQA